MSHRSLTYTDGTRTLTDVEIDQRAKHLAATDPELLEYGARNGDSAAYKLALSMVFRDPTRLSPIDRAALPLDEKIALMASELMRDDREVRELAQREGHSAGYRLALRKVDRTLSGER